MNTNNNGVLDSPQVAESEKKVLTIKDVKEMVDRDLQVVTAFLMCLQDADVRDAVVLHLHGKYMNAKHKEELSKQTDLKL